VIHPNEFADRKAKLADLPDKPFDLILGMCALRSSIHI
jgi:hypothetical protein